MVLWLLAPALVSADAVDFQRDVLPLLSDRCFACHGPDAAVRQADLRLDTRSGLLSVVTPADPGASPLLARIEHTDEQQRMPPSDSNRTPLSAAERALMRAWVTAGAPYGRHWSYQPLAQVDPPDNAERHPVDAFLRRAREVAGVAPAPQADARTLVRRLTFDLSGLPPSPQRVDEHLASASAEDYLELVEELLAAPQFGERMAVYWLDLVRFGDSSGYHSDRPVPVWPYREWVVRAFNENLPFDDFTRWQLAGDLYPEATQDQRVASIYNRLNKTTDEGGAQAGEYLVKYAADRVRTTASVWLGATLGCAECHQHKFDPVPQRDFYRFAAFFADIEEVGVYELQAYRGFQPHMQLEVAGSQVTSVATVSREPRVVRVLTRGNWLDESGEAIEPGTPECWPDLVARGERADRRDLAEWLLSPDHPLTARVFVNRLWYLLFGEGLSGVLDDLGHQGEYPSHPELLDWLAREFIQSGWDLKHMVRLLVTSAAYRQDARPRPELAGLDPNNRLVARQVRWRLDAEFVRDTCLSVAGLLRERVGGPSFKPYQPPGYWQHLNFPTRSWTPSPGDDQYLRGLYIHWQRTFLHPALLALDAPTREETCARRARSNTPLGALVLLDDPVFVEAARVFAERLLRAHADPTARLEAAFRLSLQRSPSAAERAPLWSLLGQERERFSRDPEAAAALIAVGQAPVAVDLDPVEAAAWTQVCRALLNLHETITRP